VRADHYGCRAIDELRVCGDMIAVRVGVQDEQVIRSIVPGDQVVDGGAEREELRRTRRPGVDENRTLTAEEHEHERRLVVDRLVLPQDEGVRVVLVHLDLGVGVVFRRHRPMDPGHIQPALARSATTRQ
jgi:hypothetical protein